MTSGGSHPAETAIPRRVPRWLLATGLTVVIAAVFGLVQASQSVLASANFGRPLPWSVAIVNGLNDSLLWVPLVAPIFWLTRRFPFSGARWPLALAIHLVGAVAAAGLYSTAHAAVTQWLIPESMQIGRFFRGPKPPHGPPRDSTATPPSSPETTPPASESTPPADAGARPSTQGRWRPRDRGMPEPTYLDLARAVFTTRWFLHLLTYGIIVGIWEWTAQQRRLRAGERQSQELSRQLAEARLQALRMQLNPHFLFNTLNAIATLVHKAPRIADEMISSLSEFLRMTLASPNTPQIALKKELEFARHYLEIEKVRFGDRLTIIESLDPESLAVEVPTLILQPLLENAIRHGIEPNEHRGEIRLSSRREGDSLLLVVSDTGQGLSTSKSTSRNGIGLSNTRSRLAELHGNAASLNLVDRPGTGLDVEVRIPWRTAALA